MIDKQTKLSKAHLNLIELIRHKYPINLAVIDAFIKIKREYFVPQALIHQAYEDIALPIGFGQTISQPSLVAYITDLALNQRKDKLNQILEIGSGSGYQAALLSQFADRVYSTERIESLVKMAKENCLKIGIKNIYFLNANQFDSLNNLKFDAIVMSAGYSGQLPDFLLNLLTIGGSLVFPYRINTSNHHNYELFRMIRTSDQNIESKKFADVSFVPYVNSQ